MTTTTHDVEANKDVARRLFDEVVTGGQLDLLDELLTDDATRTGLSGTFGRDSFAAHVQELHENVSDLRATVTDLVAEDDRVVVFWRLQGAHTGTVWGIPATGNTIDGTSISLITFRDGKVVDYVVTPDRFTILRQLGAIPA